VIVAICAPSREWERAAHYAGRLRDHGVNVPFAWWETGGGARRWTGRDYELDLGSQQYMATRCVDAIRAADIVWVLWGEHGTRSGAETEMGMAIAIGLVYRPGKVALVVTGRRSSESIFTSLATYRDASDEAGLVEVVKTAKRWRKLP
jgi:hypothetical protein